jgi:hypothetical protein
MSRFPSRVLLVLGLSVPACGGSVASSEQHGAVDAAAVDAQQEPAVLEAAVTPDTGLPDAVLPAEAAPDAPHGDVTAGEFCQGGAAIQLLGSGTIIDSPTLTTSELIMDCCEGAIVRLHTQAALGYNITVLIQGFANLQPGQYPQPSAESGVQVSVGKEGEWGLASSVTGTLQVFATYPEPMRVGFCIQTDATGTVEPMKLNVPDVLVAPWAWDKRWGLFLLADSAIPAEQALQVPIGSLALAAEPAVGLKSLAYYDLQQHSAHWDSWYSSPWLLTQLPPIGVHGLPFVMVADGERVYVGAFTSLMSSVQVNAPTILVETMTDGEFRLEAPPASVPDPRADWRIVKVLTETMKLVP